MLIKKGTKISNSLKEAYKYVCNIFFPRFDKKKKWSVDYSNKIIGQGYCDERIKKITVDRKEGGVELLELLIHEISHAVTRSSHGKKWRNRMLVAANLAKEIGMEELANKLCIQVKDYKKTSKLTAREIYDKIEDCLIDIPGISYENMIKLVSIDCGLYPKEFKRKYKRCKKVYKELQEDRIEIKLIKNSR